MDWWVRVDISCIVKGKVLGEEIREFLLHLHDGRVLRVNLVRGQLLVQYRFCSLPCRKDTRANKLSSVSLKNAR